MLPENVETLTKLNKYVGQAVQMLREKDTLTEDLAELKHIVEEEIGKDYAKTFPTLYKARYDSKKLLEEVEKKTEALKESADLTQYI